MVRWMEIAAWLASGFAGLWFAARALARHRAYESTAYDLGFFDQVIWNTAHGRWFQTSFTPYNFLGQHFAPVLLVFALAYKLGAGIELLVVTQGIAVAAAAIPLFYATRRATSSAAAGLALSSGFLLSAPLHGALDFDFHPELLGFLPIFLALYFLVAGRRLAIVVSLLPLLLLKEDMALVLVTFAIVMLSRGARREGIALAGIALAWTIAVVFVAMPWIRGGSGDLPQRYGYLVDGAGWWSFTWDVGSRSLGQLWPAPAAAVLRLAATAGLLPLLSPVAIAASAPALLVSALSDHTPQSRLQLHYAVLPLALTWICAVLGVARLGRISSRSWRLRGQPPAHVAGALVFVSSAVTFAVWSPYSPLSMHYAPNVAHRAAARDALRLVPAGASVSAQNTLLPHLSERRRVYEFPDMSDASFVVVDATLPITAQAQAAGYERAVAALPREGYQKVFDRDGVALWRRMR
jgi:uncharacterized membrane protein